MGNHSRVGFGAKNGDCGGESAVTYAKVCALDSPCKAPFLSPKSCREQTALPNIQSRASSTAIPRILEEKEASLSSRAAQSGVAIHSPNTQKLESSIDCHTQHKLSRTTLALLCLSFTLAIALRASMSYEFLTSIIIFSLSPFIVSFLYGVLTDSPSPFLSLPVKRAFKYSLGLFILACVGFLLTFMIHTYIHGGGDLWAGFAVSWLLGESFVCAYLLLIPQALPPHLLKCYNIRLTPHAKVGDEALLSLYFAATMHTTKYARFCPHTKESAHSQRHSYQSPYQREYLLLHAIAC